jgi:hypothetical protein
VPPPRLHHAVRQGGAACSRASVSGRRASAERVPLRSECGHGRSLRAWAQVNIHGDLAPDGNIEWPDYEDDAYWPIIEESVTCKVHGEDHIEKLIDGRHVPLADLAMEGGRYVAAPAASTEGTR